MTVSNEQVKAVREAWWKGWMHLGQHLAAVDPKAEHQILSVELLRTRTNETVAVFTVMGRDGKPHQYVVLADSRGRNVRSLRTQKEVDELLKRINSIKMKPLAPPRRGVVAKRQAAPASPARVAVRTLALMAGEGDVAPVEEEVSPDGMALGNPPKEPPPPGIESAAAAAMPVVFDLGEQVDLP